MVDRRSKPLEIFVPIEIFSLGRLVAQLFKRVTAMGSGVQTDSYMDIQEIMGTIL